MLRLAITGAGGFLGWHVRVLLRALGWPEPAVVTRADLTDPSQVAAKVAGVDRVLHLAGVNRGEPAEVAGGNVDLAVQLAEGLRRCPTPPGALVFANSVQAGNGTPYGDAKATAAGILADVGLPFDDLMLPNLYGEHGRPHYNSAVATFCRLLADGGRPEVHGDREFALVHVTDAAARLAGIPAGGSWDPGMPALRTGVRDLADRLTEIAAVYRTGEIPSLLDRHDVRLFNTYRSHCFPARYPLALPRRADARGELVETVKAHGGAGQTFCSTTRPGVTRGEHFHLAKVERFVVLRGSAEISLRRVGDTEVLRFPVTGTEPVLIDMPTMWAHKLVNTGPDELVTMFWTNELFDPARPDTWPEPVEAARPSPVAVAA
ncbi:UDP-2-acetamido-2,6-beta-L-arabino-hexul-4-ose reductase [Micromonospora echinaurantiaca]|uniref:UDP-2-acetamido-2,6-beta-L-arabino-hexul-4-ose reductase n=1 Tax=Micromonospora echinaurantiaca TaxID=47857 RepID=A0A1C5IX63_9ACTN|nr:NAD-dependent epimerase/dehydratase family protein [Micromonospora echinaurantiaca]SCG62908.1 UDP-2-acetamido-2,6-beta-L-arabino-hexul-4-ose reductase [Micromonospora echinaurantiaca]